MRKHLVPGLQDLLPPLVVLAVLLTGQDILGDSDIGWHVRAGQWIDAQRAVPRADLFSFSAAGRTWFAWEWLADLGMARLHDAAGLSGLVAAAGLVLALSFALVQRLAIRLGGSVLLALSITILGAAASTIHWLARPHVLSCLFLAVWVSVLETGRAGGRAARLWALPATMVLWCNLHGGFVIGLLVLGAYLVGALLPGAPQRWPVRWLALALALSAAATLVNPYGLQLHRHLLQFLGEPVILKHINEFRPPDFQSAHGRLLELWLLGLALVLGPTLRARDWPRVLLLLGLCHMTLTSHRHVELLVVATAPLICAMLGPVLRRRAPASLGARLERIEAIEAGRSGRCGVAMAVALTLAVVAAPQFGSWDESHRFSPLRYPVEAAEHLASVEADRILCTDSFGGYLIYRWWPRKSVFVDGRSDFYATTQVFRDYLAMQNLRPGWLPRIERYRPQAAVLPRRHPAVGWLLLVGGWAPVHADATAALLVRRDGELSAAEAALREALLAGAVAR